MNIDLSNRARSVVSGLLAIAVTTVLTSSLVGSFEPEQLLRFDQGSATDQSGDVIARRDAPVAEEA